MTNNVVAPKIRVQKTVVGLADIDDRFITQIRTGGSGGTVVSNPNSSATVGGGVFTTGGVGTYPTLGIYAATVGTTYTFTEVFAAGSSVFSQYTTAISCTNARIAGPTTTLPSGSVAPFNIIPKAGDDITCTLSNDVIQPKIKVNKTVASLVDANDRFTTQVRTGGVSGTVVSDTSASSTTGGGVLTTGGVASYNATGNYQGVHGTTYTLTEVLTAGSSNLAFQYDTSVSCTNARVGSPVTVLPTGSTQPFNIVAQAGDDITCTVTNAVRQPKVRIHKTVASLVDANDRFTTEVRLNATNSVLSDTTASTTTGGGIVTTAGIATYNATGSYQATSGTAYLLTEVISTGTSVLNQYTTSMVCTNSFATSPTVLPSGLAQPFVVTPIYGDDISCTLTNNIKQPLIRVHKSVLSLVNASDRFMTHIRTGGLGGAIVSDPTASATTGGGAITIGGAAVYNALGSYQAVIGTTYTLTEAISAGTSILAQYGTSMSCINMWTGSPTVLPVGSTAPFDVTPIAGDDIRCTFTNTANAYSISGKVFLDNGKNAATPHNGLQEVDELGLGNITVRLTDCASTVYQTTLTNGAGAYALAIPDSLTAGATLCVAEQLTNGLISVSGTAGTTGGSYNLASDHTQFTLAVAINYTDVNFGNVAESQLTGTGSQTISAGTTANYIHQFIAGTEGAVTLTTAQAPSPNLLGWTSLMYLDATCDAQLNAGDTQIIASINVVAEQVVCLIQKVQSPSTATNGAMDVSTVSASFAFTAPSVIVRPYSQSDTTIIMDSSLVLVKRLRQVSSCPSTGADVNPFVTNNQALPNELIEYQILYSNPSAATLSNITVHDITPAFTEFRSASCTTTPSSLICATPTVGSGTAPSVGGAGGIDWVLTDNPTGLGSGQGGEVRFCVRILP